MNRKPHHSSAERIGWRLGRAWRRLLRLQKASRRGLIRAGLSVGTANLLIACVWAGAAVAILHYRLWVVVVVAGALISAALGWSDVPNSATRKYQWRMGYMGFGYYNSAGIRVDPHNADVTD